MGAALGLAVACGSTTTVVQRVDDPVQDASTAAERPDGLTPDDPQIADLEDGELLPGGATTTTRLDVGAFVQQAANLGLARRQQFEAGLQFVQLPWEVAPGRPEADGLGPTFHATSCLDCHASNGRAAPQRSPDDLGIGTMLRLGSAADGSPDPHYGGQLQPFGIAGVPGEGRVHRYEDEVAHVLADGTTCILHMPRYELTELAFGPLADGVVWSPRLAPHVVGQGLLEAIASADLLARVDESDQDGDGISGRAQWVTRGGETLLGRFGWKAGQPTVAWQTAAAFAEDLGITSPLLPEAGCPEAQDACASAQNGGTPELNATRLAAAAAYVRLLGVPVRRSAEDRDVRRGKWLFGAHGCAGCHHPSYVTSQSVEPELAAQRIWPYTDLLLHDLGDRLADGRPEGEATGREWRTPPLWSIGLLPVVSGHQALLHDGRARGVEEAVLWHGGEADAARLAYERSSGEDRAALVRFVESL